MLSATGRLRAATVPLAGRKAGECHTRGANPVASQPPRGEQGEPSRECHSEGYFAAGRDRTPRHGRRADINRELILITSPRRVRRDRQGVESLPSEPPSGTWCDRAVDLSRSGTDAAGELEHRVELDVVRRSPALGGRVLHVPEADTDDRRLAADRRERTKRRRPAETPCHVSEEVRACRRHFGTLHRGARTNLAESQGILGDVGRARGHFEQSLRLSRELGLEVDIGHALHGLGELERDAGNFDRAAELHEESLSISQRIDDPRMASATTHGLGDLALEQADLETASGRYAEALVRYFEAEEPRSLAYTLGGLAAVAALRGEVNRAGRLWSALERIEEERAAEIGRSERERYEARLRTLDPAELARAVADGRELPLEVVIEEALSGR